MIDHAAEARAHLTDVEAYANDAHSHRFDDENGRAVQALAHAGLSAQQAKAHATLALVEQQRIANLIALASWGGKSDEALDLLRAEASNSLATWVPHDMADEHLEIRPDIATALGIGEAK